MRWMFGVISVVVLVGCNGESNQVVPEIAAAPVSIAQSCRVDDSTDSCTSVGLHRYRCGKEATRPQNCRSAGELSTDGTQAYCCN